MIPAPTEYDQLQTDCMSLRVFVSVYFFCIYAVGFGRRYGKENGNFFVSHQLDDTRLLRALMSLFLRGGVLCTFDNQHL